MRRTLSKNHKAPPTGETDRQKTYYIARRDVKASRDLINDKNLNVYNDV